MTNDFPVFLEEGKNTQFWYNYREYDLMNSRVLNTKLFNLKKWIMAEINDGTNSEQYY